VCGSSSNYVCVCVCEVSNSESVYDPPSDKFSFNNNHIIISQMVHL
jgi:hypothetical protein